MCAILLQHPQRNEHSTDFQAGWRNVEVLEFVDWLRSYNEQRSRDDRVEFRGLDIYSLRVSIAAVLHYLGSGPIKLLAKMANG
jgi:erythromycin esterase-like protein